MSRSNNPGTPAGGHHPQRAADDSHQPAWPPAQPPLPNWPPQQQPQQPQAYAPPPQPQAQDPYAGYHYPQPAAQADTYHLPPQPPARPGYAPQFERFAPPPQAPHAPAPHQPPQQAYQQPPGAPAYPPPPPQPGVHAQPPAGYPARTAAPAPPQQRPAAPPPPPFNPQAFAPPEPPRFAPPPADPVSQGRAAQRTAPPQMPPQQMPPQQQAPQPPMRPAPDLSSLRAPPPDLRGSIHDAWPGQPQARSAPQGQPDPRGFDLGAYASPPQPARTPFDPATIGSLRADWQAQNAAPATQGQPAYGQPHAQATGQAMVTEHDYGHDDVEYEDEPPRKSRGLVIVGALVGAIALGGGLAYGYKTLLGPGSTGKTPVIAAPTTPSKTSPSDPGGKQFANRDVKVMNQRLTDVAQPADDGTKRVQTVNIGRDGSISPPVAPPAPVGPPEGGLPGVYVVQPPTRPVMPPVAMAPPQPQNPAPIQARSNPEPRTITLTPPGTQQAPQPQVQIAQPPAPPKAPPVAKAPPPPVQPRVSVATVGAPEPPAPAPKRPTPRPAAAPGGGGGYVAVLASRRSTADALNAFVDMQQRYSALSGKTPSVQEANLGDKGTYYRLVVPAGAREQASALCTELKASGHSDCWIKAQ